MVLYKARKIHKIKGISMHNIEIVKKELKKRCMAGQTGKDTTEYVDKLLGYSMQQLSIIRNIDPQLREQLASNEPVLKAISILTDLLKILKLPYEWVKEEMESVNSGDPLKLWNVAKNIVNEIDKKCQNAGYIDIEKRIELRKKMNY